MMIIDSIKWNFHLRSVKYRIYTGCLASMFHTRVPQIIIALNYRFCNLKYIEHQPLICSYFLILKNSLVNCYILLSIESNQSVSEVFNLNQAAGCI